MPIDRRPLRDQVREEVLRLLSEGEIEADEPINEGQLAAQLGVSRTPLREALITLQHEGVIVSSKGKGFRFSALSRGEFTDLCQLLAGLEVLALQLSEPEALQTVAHELLRKAEEFTASEASVETIERNDDEWHALMLSACANVRLIELINSVKVGMHRYEQLQVGVGTMVHRTAEEHQRIAQCLIEQDLPGASTALKRNWHSGMQRILELIDGPAGGDQRTQSVVGADWWADSVAPAN